MNPQRKRKASTASVAIMRHFLLVVFIIGISAISSRAGDVTPASLLPQRTPLNVSDPSGSAPPAIAKVKIGMKRKDAVKMLSQAPGPILSVVETYFDRVLGPAPQSHSVMLDLVFQPASMRDAQFAATLPRADTLRRRGEWPLPEADDTIRAVSLPYVGPEYSQFALEVSRLPKSIRARLQSLKVGMTRNELEHSYAQAMDRCRLPTEAYNLRHALVHGHLAVRVDFDFRPAAMDETTYADSKLRSEWYRQYMWWPGENSDDIVTAIHRPRETDRGGESPLSLDSIPESDRALLKHLQLGMTRKQLVETFRQCGGFSSPQDASYFLPHKTEPGPFRNERLYITVRIEFESAAASQDPKPSGPVQFRHMREADTDVVTGFSRPYASALMLD